MNTSVEVNPYAAIRPLTNGDGFFWFGYYDKQQFDPSGRYVLCMRSAMENRSPAADDQVDLGLIDLQDHDRWTTIGQSRAWCWQQGCMLQWLPGSTSEVIWNDRDGDRFVGRILDISTGQQRTLPMPIYTISPDGRLAASPDFARLQHTRPGYGYAGVADPNFDVNVPKDSGLWVMDLKTGEHRLIFTVADAAAMPGPHRSADGKHWFNHLLFSPSGERLVFFHRWMDSRTGRGTRMLSIRPDGSDVRVVDDFGRTSHFIWRDPQHILAWSPQKEGDGFYLFEDGTGRYEPVGRGVMTRDGHVSYLPDSDWILNDSYPQGPDRIQELFLYHIPTNRKIILGRFPVPPQYTGEWRCDLHPRISRDGRMITIDSAHEGRRRMYLLQIGNMLNS